MKRRGFLAAIGGALAALFGGAKAARERTMDDFRCEDGRVGCRHGSPLDPARCGGRIDEYVWPDSRPGWWISAGKCRKCGYTFERRYRQFDSSPA